MENKIHAWYYVQFHYATWTKCECGYVPSTDEEFYHHSDINNIAGNWSE